MFSAVFADVCLTFCNFECKLSNRDNSNMKIWHYLVYIESWFHWLKCFELKRLWKGCGKIWVTISSRDFGFLLSLSCNFSSLLMCWSWIDISSAIHLLPCTCHLHHKIILNHQKLLIRPPSRPATLQTHPQAIERQTLHSLYWFIHQQSKKQMNYLEFQISKLNFQTIVHLFLDEYIHYSNIVVWKTLKNQWARAYLQNQEWNLELCSWDKKQWIFTTLFTKFDFCVD